MTKTIYLTEVELERELTVRLLPCPTCGARMWQRCDYTRISRNHWQATSHTGRYDAAAAAGLVPPLERQVVD